VSSLPTITPKAPTLAKPFHRPGWVYEENYDWRMIASKSGPTVRVVSRNAVDQVKNRHREQGRARRGLKCAFKSRVRSGSRLRQAWTACGRL